MKGCLAFVCLLFVPSRARAADPMELRSRAVDAGQLVVDGDPGDWRGIRAKRLGYPGRIVRGAGAWQGPEDASVRFALAHDSVDLYLAVRVLDDDFRSGRDEVVLHLSFGGGRVHTVEATPGDGRRTAARLKLDGRALASGEVVEMITEDGWNLEAKVPWASFPEAARERSELRVALVLTDVDARGTTVLASVPGPPSRAASLAPLWFSDQESTLRAFLSERDLQGAWPSFETSGNVAGDSIRERVLVVEGELVVFGPGYRGGRGYFYQSLPVARGQDVLDLRVTDVTGDGRDEILIRYLERGPGGHRGVFAIYSFRGEDPRRIFEAEFRKETARGSVETEVRVQERGEETRIEMRPGRASGLDARSYREVPAGDMEPILLPWGTIARRTYRFDGTRFVRESEETREAPPEPREAGARQQPQQPAGPTQEDVFARFLQQSGLVGTRPTFDLRGNVAGDRQEERVAVVGKRLVVLGPGFAGGTSFFFMDLPVTEPGDVLALDLRDLTGDGRADLLVRIRQLGEGWGHEVFQVAQFSGEALQPLLSQEVVLFQGANRVENEVRFVRRGRGFDIEVIARRVQGWTAETFPARGDPGHVRPILLPWAEPRRIRLRYAEGRYQ